MNDATNSRRQAGRLGGSVTAAQSPAKAAALAALHAACRGQRRTTAGAAREREVTLADLAAAIREPVRGVASIRVVAAYCGVSDRTVRRWLTGEDWPPASQIRRMRAWLRQLRP